MDWNGLVGDKHATASDTCKHSSPHFIELQTVALVHFLHRDITHRLDWWTDVRILYTCVYMSSWYVSPEQKMAATHGIRRDSKRDNCPSCCQLTFAHRAQSHPAHCTHRAHIAQTYLTHLAHVSHLAHRAQSHLAHIVHCGHHQPLRMRSRYIAHCFEEVW